MLLKVTTLVALARGLFSIFKKSSNSTESKCKSADKV